MQSDVNAFEKSTASAVDRSGAIDAKHEAFRRYTLIDKDDQEISRTAGELLEGSKLLANRELWTANIVGVIRKIQKWCETNSAQLSAALLTFHHERITIYLVSAQPRYDLDLDSKMTDLEVDLGGSGGVGSVETFLIPDRSVDKFAGEDAVMLWKKLASN